jgi:hypothetical protein
MTQKMRIKRLDVLSVAKLVGGAYFLIATVIILPIALIVSAIGLTDELIPGFAIGGVALILIPVFYGIAGFISSAIFCVIYNLISGMVGGIEMELETVSE